MKNQLEITQEANEKINIFIHLSEKFKNAYFWSSPTSAKERRKMEEINVVNYKDENLEFHFSLSVSCHHIYVRKYILINGKTKNIVSLKNLLKNKIPAPQVLS